MLELQRVAGGVFVSGGDCIEGFGVQVRQGAVHPRCLEFQPVLEGGYILHQCVGIIQEYRKMFAGVADCLVRILCIVKNLVQLGFSGP